jgi:hypothetical protein
MRTNIATASPGTTGLKIASGAGMPSVRQLSGNRGDPRLGASPCSVPARRHPLEKRGPKPGNRELSPRPDYPLGSARGPENVLQNPPLVGFCTGLNVLGFRV